MMIGYFLIPIVFMVIGMIVSWRLKSRMTLYAQMPLRSGMTGREIAEKMLRDNGIFDVKVTSTPGFLTDHYNPWNKTVNLSDGVYNSRSVAAAAVAAHECGHAVQHARAYPWIKLRSALVPAASVGGYVANICIMIGLYFMQHNSTILLIGIAGYAMTTLFTLVTLPVEFDATRRGLNWLDSARITSGQEHTAAISGLRWAAMTYVVAALASLAQLLYLIMIYMGRRD
jgi:uncharacterized protein